MTEMSPQQLTMLHTLAEFFLWAVVSMSITAMMIVSDMCTRFVDKVATMLLWIAVIVGVVAGTWMAMVIL